MFIETSQISDAPKKPRVFTEQMWKEQSVIKVWATICKEQETRTSCILLENPTMLQSFVFPWCNNVYYVKSP